MTELSYEQRILERLAGKYRKSRKDSGKAKIQRRTRLRPSELYKKYSDNDADLSEIQMIREAAERLAVQGFVSFREQGFGYEILEIVLQDEKINEAEQYLSEKFGVLSRDQKLSALQALTEEYRNRGPLCARYCERLSKRIREKHLPPEKPEPEEMLRVFSFLESNREDLYLREASMRIFGKSKYLEEELLEPVCREIRIFLNRPAGEDELPDEILSEYRVQVRTQNILLKGNWMIRGISDAGVTFSLDTAGLSQGIALDAAELPHITELSPGAETVLTVENLTSYRRISAERRAVLYLGGYVNRWQRNFLRMLHGSAPSVSYFHFGDLDPGGFLIHEDLCRKTGIAFGLHRMSVRELQNPVYRECLQPLSANDRRRLQRLKEDPRYAETVGYMLSHDVKLEQEIISLMDEN